MNIDQYRKSWNKRQTEFRRVLMSFDQHDRAMQLFFSQHAMLHSAKMADSEPWSFEDQVLNDMNDEQLRRVPSNCEHSVVWCIWHLARIEDVAMNMLVAGSPQILNKGSWLERMKIEVQNTGNAMAEEVVIELSNAIDIKALREYRIAVGRRTREIVSQLPGEDLDLKVDEDRLQRVLDEGAVVPTASGLIDYWGKRNLAGLLLMPATRHNFVHLNEANRLKQRRG